MSLMERLMSKQIRPRQRGFTLLEVLVALLVMSFGMLGISSLMLVTARINTSSVTKQLAIQSANNIIDRIRANRAAAIANAYSVNDLASTGTPSYPTTPSADCSSSSCSPTDLATYDVWYWLTNDVGQLPLGSGAVTTQASGSNTLVTVTVQWDDAPAQNMVGAAASSVSTAPHIAALVVTTLL
jgi:type IV pilus assembly protein PilV